MSADDSNEVSTTPAVADADDAFIEVDFVSISLDHAGQVMLGE